MVTESPSGSSSPYALISHSKSRKALHKGEGLSGFSIRPGNRPLPKIRFRGLSRTESSNILSANSTGMTGTVQVEIVGLKTSECSPFPCDENRTCGLSGCYLSGKLNDAFNELKKVLQDIYGTRVELKLTLIDEGVPDHIRTIIERDYPPIPMVLVNGRLTRIGRISLDRIKNEIEKEL